MMKRALCIGVLFLIACYEIAPPCRAGARWPDPCDGIELDAGSQ